ncbi:hypothetical protein SRABI91_02962 [Rhodococcoides fascians]|nr:hypothetical protein SRABI91_02962 [Rhodococcus fascians]
MISRYNFARAYVASVSGLHAYSSMNTSSTGGHTDVADTLCRLRDCDNLATMRPRVPRCTFEVGHAAASTKRTCPHV